MFSLLERSFPAIPCRHCGRFLGILAFLFLPSNVVEAEDSEDAGRAIYVERCASCHGARGEGVPDKVDDPLTGNRSPGSLAKYIEEKMPEDSPELCTGEDAKKVANYIHGAFYSRVARARNSPARIELARLTASQYRNSVADLVAGFRTQQALIEKRGLNAQYYSGRNSRGAGKVRRIDRRLHFDFKNERPVENVSQEEYSVRWSGSLLPVETGEHEFSIDCMNGSKLFLNDDEKPLIDAWVRSGSETKKSASLFLLAGRLYPIRVEFSKAKKDKTASISLSWKPPRGVEEVIPSRHLVPQRSSEVLVIDTPFPPDDRSLGYERGTSISKAWLEASTHSALRAATYISWHLEELARYKGGADDARESVSEFCRRFAERAFRRPLTADQFRFFVEDQISSAKNLQVAAKRVILLVLASPRFLFHELDIDGDYSYALASRISFGLWDSLPDAELLKAARTGWLVEAEEVRSQVRRMIDDQRTRAKMREFFQVWLRIDHLSELTKSSERFPEFDESLAADLRTSLDLFLGAVVWNERSDFRDLFLADYLYLNERLAKFYSVEPPGGDDFLPMAIDEKKRAGIVTHPLLMAGFAYEATSSPIHRGVFVARNLLGRRLRPPPEAFAPVSPDLHPDLTTRERIGMQTKPEACRSCHDLINPLGFAFENFDAVGRFREKEKNRLVDASGFYKTLDGPSEQFIGARELGMFLARSPEVHAAFVERLFQHIVKQPIMAYGPKQHENLRLYFEKSEYSIRALLIELVTSSVMHSVAEKEKPKRVEL